MIVIVLANFLVAIQSQILKTLFSKQFDHCDCPNQRDFGLGEQKPDSRSSIKRFPEPLWFGFQNEGKSPLRPAQVTLTPLNKGGFDFLLVWISGFFLSRTGVHHFSCCYTKPVKIEG